MVSKNLLEILIPIVIFFMPLQGCAYLAHSEQLTALKGFSESQREKEKYVEAQEKSFDRLRDDITKNRLRKGVSKRRIISKYGDPVFCEDGERETCLYRYPMGYISTDKAYLYFDEERKLYLWEFEPVN